MPRQEVVDTDEMKNKMSIQQGAGRSSTTILLSHKKKTLTWSIYDFWNVNAATTANFGLPL